MADQLLSSLTNFVLGVVVARTVTPQQFGAFTLAFVTYTLALAGSRALASEPLMVRYSASSPVQLRRGLALSSGMALAFGLVISVVCLVVSATAGRSLAPAFRVLALCVPVLLLQDSWRYGFFAAGRGALAFANDLVWAVALIPAIGVVLATGTGSVPNFMLAWGGAAAVAACFGVLQTRTLPQPAKAATWLREERDLAPLFLIESAVTTGTTQLTLYSVGVVAGLGAVGSLRAGQLLIGPVQMTLLAMSLVAVPEAVRVLKSSPDRLRQTAVLYSSVLAALALAWGAFAFLLPARIGMTLLSDNWEGGHRVVVPLAISAAASGLSFGAGVGLRSLGAARRSLRTRQVEACVTVVSGLGGAALGGALGVAWAFAVGAALVVPLWWWQLDKALREDVDTSQSDPTSSFYSLG